MADEQAMVEAFHRTFDIVVNLAPTVVDVRTRELRVKLIQEEFDELKEALAAEDLSSIAKEMADLLYVVYGTAVSYGIDMNPVFREVHRSNMSKVGGYKRGDGKWVKPRASTRLWRSRGRHRARSVPYHEGSTLSKLRGSVRPRDLPGDQGRAPVEAHQCVSVSMPAVHESVSCVLFRCAPQYAGIRSASVRAPDGLHRGPSPRPRAVASD